MTLPRESRGHDDLARIQGIQRIEGMKGVKGITRVSRICDIGVQGIKGTQDSRVWDFCVHDEPIVLKL